MSRYLIIFIVGSILAIGSLIVWGRSNQDKKSPDISELLYNFNTPKTPSIVSQASPTPSPKQPQVTHLIIEDIQVGTGAAVKSGDSIEVNYVGYLLNGQKFDSSLDRNETFNFILGTGQVIPGWDQGLEGMRMGGIRRLTIPSELAYGSSGNGPIPPNSPLIFEVQLVNIKQQ